MNPETRPRVLVVEDDRETREFVARALAEIGLDVTAVGAIAPGQAAENERPFDLLVLDRMLPDGTTLTWIHDLRRRGNGVPVLILTALSDVSERVKGLEAGCDDYLGKPFAPLELKARARALLRRGHRTRREVREGRLRLDLDRREAFVEGAELALTEREFRVLELLVTAKGIGRDQLLDEVWGESTPETGASLDVIVSRLRRKLGALELPSAIETVRGYGFKWRGGG
ncbi:MAG: response regulator transcription factor [Thermoanaerobaculia bacterium]